MRKICYHEGARVVGSTGLVNLPHEIFFLQCYKKKCLVLMLVKIVADNKKAVEKILKKKK